MADSLNPFLGNDDDVEIETIKKSEEDNSTIGDSSDRNALVDQESLNWDAVASKLLKEKLILTALELHSELGESGRDLPRLRDFFSNPANFERTKLASDISPSGLPRTNSVQTFDSLDFARYSDDGDRQETEKVAVLEFELRKAHETIKSLRASLTKSAEPELPTPSSEHETIEESTTSDNIKPYEKRAISFLVNEYLLIYDYKLTSVTFAEENENQDFEDWDDVGLNIAKPPDLLHLYRDYGQHVMPDESCEMKDAECYVDLQDEDLTKTVENLHRVNEELRERIGVLEDELVAITNENTFLTTQIKQYERVTAKSNAEWSSTPIVSPITTPSQTPVKPDKPTTKSSTVVMSTPSRQSEDAAGDQLDGVKPLEQDLGELDLTAEEIQEVLDKRDTASGVVIRDSTTTKSSEVTGNPEVGTAAACTTGDSLQVEIGSDVIDQNVTLGMSTREDPIGGEVSSSGMHESWSPSTRNMPESFQKALLDLTFHTATSNRIVSEVSQINQLSNHNYVILMLGRCLPHIVPNVILAKREELIPLIVIAATLHPDSKQRDQLLNILFNLIKRPDVDQRHMILTGCVSFARHVGPQRVESDLLPQCWEQITHKYAERRLLVAEACGALAPYLPSEIRSSLVLSMLQQMLEEDKVEEVREAVVRSLGLVYGFIDTVDKYIQGGQLLMKTLIDSSEKVSTVALNVFLPTFGMWTMELEKLEKDLIPSLLGKLRNLVNSSPHSSASQLFDESRFCTYVRCLQELTAVLFAMVVKTGPFTKKLDLTTKNVSHVLVSSRFPTSSSPLTDLSVILDSGHQLATLTQLYEDYISEEWYEPWEEYAWIAGEFIPELINFMNTIDASRQSIVQSLSKFFYNLCRTFGRTFTVTKVRPKFQVVLSIPEDHIDSKVSSNQSPLTKSTAAVFASGILAAFSQEEDHKALSCFLQDLMHTLALSQASLNSINAAFVQLCQSSDYYELLLSVLWDGVVHTSALVRKTSALVFELVVRGTNEHLVSNRVIPALVTLASDPEISVRTSTIPALGTIIETVTDRVILDKVYMQLQSFVDDPTYKDQHGVHLELVRTFARVGPNAEPKFRDDFVLPRLAVLAANNNQQTNEHLRKEIAVQLFEAYSALSCCFISDYLISEMMLPGLRCLLGDVQEVAQDHVQVVESMIREFEEKVDSGRLNERSSNVTITVQGGGGGAATSGTGEAMKTKMFSRFKDVTSRFGSKK